MYVCTYVCMHAWMYVWYGMVWYGMVWCGVVWCGVVWCGMVWYGMVWYGMVWYGMVWYGMVWYGMVCFCDSRRLDTLRVNVPANFYYYCTNELPLPDLLAGSSLLNIRHASCSQCTGLLKAVFRLPGRSGLLVKTSEDPLVVGIRLTRLPEKT